MNHGTDSTVPVAWPDLLAREQPNMRAALATYDRLPEILETVRPPFTIAARFGSPAADLAHAAAVLGPEECLPALGLLEPFVPSACAEMENGIDEALARPAVFLLDYINLARTCGGKVPAIAVELEFDILKSVVRFAESFEDTRCQILALAAVATGLTPLVPQYLAGDPMPDAVAAGEVFFFDFRGFTRYLAVAFEQGLTADDVAPAWRNFVESFPRKLAAGTADWIDLFWAARAYLTLFERRPVETVAGSLHEMVSS